MEDIYNPEDAFVTTLGTFTLFGLWPSAVKHPLLRLLRFKNFNFFRTFKLGYLQKLTF